ncbi:hypothetical protein QBC41DRAFT_36996 [Cercophora samala]|uniref:Uncharacterized protein n=1 Tax=Cercophora samala TaxID=330535 RepID=A0AA39YZ80_9PEZI|nr:hypothetical protein QBC41DRAFT_36996 [Cercophora samala]
MMGKVLWARRLRYTCLEGVWTWWLPTLSGFITLEHQDYHRRTSLASQLQHRVYTGRVYTSWETLAKSYANDKDRIGLSDHLRDLSYLQRLSYLPSTTVLGRSTVSWHRGASSLVLLRHRFRLNPPPSQRSQPSSPDRTPPYPRSALCRLVYPRVLSSQPLISLSEIGCRLEGCHSLAALKFSSLNICPRLNLSSQPPLPRQPRPGFFCSFLSHLGLKPSNTSRVHNRNQTNSQSL